MIMVVCAPVLMPAGVSLSVGDAAAVAMVVAVHLVSLTTTGTISVFRHDYYYMTV